MRYVFYDSGGNLHPEVKHVDPVFLKINTPDGFKALAHDTAKPGHHRVEVDSVAVIRGPQPTNDHVWNDKIERWELSESVATRQAQERAARLRVSSLEQQSLRPMRELFLNINVPVAKKKLQEIDEKISELRKQL